MTGNMVCYVIGLIIIYLWLGLTVGIVLSYTLGYGAGLLLCEFVVRMYYWFKYR